MKRISVMMALLAATLLAASQAAPGGAGGELESVLSRMDAAAQSFKSAQSAFEQELYLKVTEEKEIQKGQIYFRRGDHGTDVSVVVEGPGARQIVFKDGKARMYQPKLDQITEYETGKNKSDIEAFISLGFGGRGHDLQKSYEVRLAGWETVEADKPVKAARLELTPTSARQRGMFSKIVLWVDPERDVLVRQQLFEPSGDYRLVRYSEIKLNRKLPEGVFSIKSTSHTTTVKPG
jgi:outer membrane lipoprotein-sorting protein